MKSLKTYMVESLLTPTKTKVEQVANGEWIRREVEAFIKEHCWSCDEFTVSEKPNKNGRYEVSVKGRVQFQGQLKSVATDLFEWGTVDEFVSVGNGLETLEGGPKIVNDLYMVCDADLTSLKGIAKKIGGSLYLDNMYKLTSLKGCPKKVNGNFSCKDCKELTSLEGCPTTVTGSFNCSHTGITSLKGCPKKVGGTFWCSDTNITSLEGSPTVGESFECNNCYNLKSLVGAPKHIPEDFRCRFSGLTTLKGAPEIVGGSFDAGRCKIKNLEGSPRKVGGYFSCGCRTLVSLVGAPESVGGFDCSDSGVEFDRNVINKYCKVENGQYTC
jgi:hypothetical protein